MNKHKILSSGIAQSLKNLTYKNNFRSSFSNLFITLRIFLTLSFNVTSNERQFFEIQNL